MKNYKYILILPILVIIITSILLINGSTSLDTSLALVTDINYTESTREINNPERGFYEPIGINMGLVNNKVLNPTNNLIHLRVGIGAFSSQVNGDKDLMFTDDMLNALDQTLKNIKNNGGSVIIRFAYDNFNGTKDLEPSMSMILTHIKQLESLFNDNADVIAYIELGFFGPWGEMHSSSICTNENVNEALKLMLSITPEDMKIGVRTPGYYASYVGINRDILNENITKLGEDAYRIGLYNDGYLGSESDLGTFKNRDIEISWLNNQAKHTFYGGEVVANYASSTPLNTIEYISSEGFITHTTYLNLRWNNTVIDEWKNTIYNGNDELYNGSSGFLYVNNHLGYRYVLTSSNLSNIITTNSNLEGYLTINNVGFANLINKKITTIILTNGESIYEITTDIDARSWDSNTISDVNFSISLPNDITIGNWKVYLRISQYGEYETDNNYNCIEFANDNIYDETLGANYIGTINIINQTTTTMATTTSIPQEDILYIESDDEYTEVVSQTTESTTKPTTTTTTTTNLITTSKTTKVTTTTTTKKTTTKKTTTTLTTTSKTTTTLTTSISETKDEGVVIEESNTKNIRGLVVILFVILIICLILINHYRI